MKQFLSLFFVVVVFGIARIAFAQVVPEDIVTSTVPTVPGPYETVTISLSSFSADLNRASISWYTDGTLKLSGTGKKDFSAQTGPVGSTVVVTAHITLGDGTAIDKRIVLAPSEVDILFEAIDSYVPPFYRGKALPAKEATLRAIAMPNIKINGASIKAADLVYSWKENYDPLPDDSGYGKQALNFKSSYLHPEENVEVQVSSLSSGTTADGKIAITPVAPGIVLYKNSLAEGTEWRQALNTGFVFGGSEMGIFAAPYYFSPKDATDNQLVYAWSLNGQAIQTPTSKNLLVLRKKSEDVGQAQVSLAIKNLIRLFQSSAISASATLTK